MKNSRKENTFLIVWCFCVVTMLVICFSNVNITLKGTNAYFGDGTTGSFTVYTIYYYSDYPDGTLIDGDPVSDKQGSNFNKLLANMFEVPVGYEFVGWRDENGGQYLPEDVKVLTKDFNLYARWELIVSDDDVDDTTGDNSDDSTVLYGDVNLNGEIDSDDYLLVENHVAGIGILTGNALVNADVNIDGKVDLVDADIIKNAYLGTKNYVGYLPSNPILIYDIYEGNIDVGTGDNTETGNNDANEDEIDSEGNGLGGGTGSGSSGSGNSSSGSGGAGSGHGGSSSNGSSSGGSASSGGSSSNSSQSNNSSNKDNDEKDDEEINIEPEPIYYEFKYMNGNLEFANTKCEVINNNCELVLPSNNPVRSGYTFKGWSLNKDCASDNIVNAAIMVKSSNTYYACYLQNVDSEESGSKYYVWVIVFAISGLSLRLIWHLIYKFRNDENNDLGNDK